jgi:hypothetical protein
LFEGIFNLNMDDLWRLPVSERSLWPAGGEPRDLDAMQKFANLASEILARGAAALARATVGRSEYAANALPILSHATGHFTRRVVRGNAVFDHAILLTESRSTIHAL